MLCPRSVNYITEKLKPIYLLLNSILQAYKDSYIYTFQVYIKNTYAGAVTTNIFYTKPGRKFEMSHYSVTIINVGLPV